MADVDADAIEELLISISRILELKGENPFKIRAYSNAARVVGAHAGDIVEAARAGTLDEIEGIGKAIAEKIAEFVERGRLAYHDKLRDEFPPEIFQLFELQGLGAKKIKVLHDKLQVHSIPRLERACKDGRVAELDGFGRKSADNLLKAIEHWKRQVGYFRLGDVYGVALRLLDDLRAHPAVHEASLAGSVRRMKEIVHDLDFLVATGTPAAVAEDFAGHELVDEVLARGETKCSVRLGNGLQCDLRMVKTAEFPFALAYFTGCKEHNIAMRGMALKRGWSLNEYRFSPVEGGKKPAALPKVETEAQLYAALDLGYVEPELREGRGELDAAAGGALPKLIEWQNLRGTFHNHTSASDGQNSLEEMADAARELGLQYLGIADHSKASFQANGLDAKRLREQVKRIADLNAGYGGEFRIFSGTECDILKDGSLDFPDEELAALDYVVASVHSSFTLGEAEMTKRLIRAMENRHITMLGHPSGRLILTREPYAVNMPAVIDAAAETGTIIELNANPRRLDMDWRWWPLAKEKGVKCAINPDAHRTAGLQHLFFGVAAARKGWLTRGDVINCLPLGKIEDVLAAKRRKTG